MGLPVANERGEHLVGVVDGGEAETALANAGKAIAFSLVLALHDTRILLVRNRRRSRWELPGGFVDAGESPEQCAARELAEESGQTTSQLRLLAVLELAVAGNAIIGGAATRRGTLYRARIEQAAAFVPTPEVAAIGFWPADALPADTSAIDAALALHFAGTAVPDYAQSVMPSRR